MTKETIDWPKHFEQLLDLRTNGFRELLDLRRQAIEQRLDYQTKAQEEVERRLTERIEERQRLQDRAFEHINERMQQIYHFRDQINSERLTYITRDQQDSNNKVIEDQLDLLKRAVQLSAGKDTGTSRVWTGIAMALSAGAAIGSIVTAISVFMRHPL